MKNKVTIIALIIPGIALVVLVGFYFVKQNKSLINLPQNAMQSNQASTGNQEKANDGIGVNNQIQNKLVTDDFEVTLPAGWEKTAPAIGASAMAVNRNEKLDDPAAQKINFKSYLAVSYDTLQGKGLSEYLQTVKNGLSQIVSNVVFTNEQDVMINGRSAHALEAELAQQGVNFKILMVVITGQGEDVWVMSFNTIKSSWDGYQETFSDMVQSFSLKK